MNLMDDPMLRELVEHCHIEVPKEAVEEEAFMMEAELKHEAQYGLMGGSVDTFTLQDEMQERLDAIPALAYRTVKTEMVLDRLIKGQNLMPTPLMLEEEAMRLAKEKKIAPEMVKKFFGEDYGLLVRDLQIRMAMDLIHSGSAE